MAQLTRQDIDLVLAGMILIVAGAIGQVLFQLLRDNRYASLFPYGMILFFADLSLIAGLIVFALGMFRLIRRVESRLPL